MSACSKYVPRLKEALEYRGLTFPKDIIDAIGKRAKSDRELDNIINEVTDILEPPVCQKSHCPHHTVYRFCNCSLSLVPGKCKLNLDYLKRKKEKIDKIFNDRLSKIPVTYIPLTKENTERIKNMSDADFIKAIKKLKKQHP